MRYFAYTLFTALIFIGSVTFSYAASLYIDPSSGIYGRGDTFSAKVRIDAQEECINAVDIWIGYPQNSIQAVEVGRGESIITLWIEAPSIDKENGIVHLIGGIPGGYCGRIPGDPGLTNVIGEIIFRVPGFTVGVPGESEGDIVFRDGTEVLLNDGLGTSAKLIAFDARFEITEERTGTNEWFESLKDDDVPPEPYSIQLTRTESVYEGKWYVVFTTLDKQSGIDHFEIFETDIENDGFKRGESEKAQWIRITSPHVLQDQTLNSIIRIRAFDKAGNQRLAALIPDESLRKKEAFGSIQAPKRENILLVFGGIALLILLVVVLFVMRRARKIKRSVLNNIAAPPTEGDTGEISKHDES